MVEQGFNICIIARSEEKIAQRLEEITKEFPKVRTFSVVADFDKIHTIEDYKTQIGDQLRFLDIAMLFLNAGVSHVGAFADITNQEVQEMVSVNALQPIYCAKVLLPIMLKRANRGQRSAIVVTSSGLGGRPVAGTITYSAAKAFSSFLAQGLSYELEEQNVDVLSWECGPTQTKMMRGRKGAKLLSPEAAVKGMLRDLGKERLTYGVLKNDRSSSLFMAMPSGFINRMMFKAMKGARERRIKEGLQ